jgi:beta-galactosidase GanA
MMKASTTTRRLLALLMLGAGIAASAHSFHAGLVDISYNATTKSTEVVHTYMTHDVEALLLEVYGRQFDLTDADDQAVLRTYIDKQFWLLDKDGKRLALNWVGITVDTDSVGVFQEAVQTPSSRVETIHDGVLSDFLPDQQNTVNLTADGKLRTFGFNSGRKEINVH